MPQMALIGVDMMLTQHLVIKVSKTYPLKVSTGQPHEGSSYASQKVGSRANFSCSSTVEDLVLTEIFRCCRWPGTDWSMQGAGSQSLTGKPIKKNKK